MKTALHALILLGLLSVGCALECYVCNSHESKDCFSMPEASRAKYLKNCNQLDVNNSVNYTLCRKLHMFMDQDVGEVHPSEDRVHRSCGFLENIGSGVKIDGDCYYKSGYNTRTWVCTCKEDQCNAASTISTTTALAFIVLALVLVMLRPTF